MRHYPVTRATRRSCATRTSASSAASASGSAPTSSAPSRWSTGRRRTTSCRRGTSRCARPGAWRAGCASRSARRRRSSRTAPRSAASRSGRRWSRQTTCGYCGVGCQLELHTDRKGRVFRVTAPAGEGVNQGNLCGKGRFGYHFVNHPDRLPDAADQEGRRAGAGHLGGGDRRWSPEVHGDPRRRTGRTPSPGSRRRAARTRTTTSSRSSSAPWSARTTSTTAPDSDTAPRWPVWPPRSGAGR